MIKSRLPKEALVPKAKMRGKYVSYLLKLANSLDSSKEFESADCCDDVLAEIVIDKNLSEGDAMEALLRTITLLYEGKEKFIDDGRFGINDHDNPTVKAANVV